MPSYHLDAEVSPATRQYRPVLEMRIATNGALLAASEARYATLQEYITQFAAPLSQLPGIGWWSFYDPCLPACTLLVQCEPEAWCDRCCQALRVCDCPF